jgi:hypothetical protein
MRILQDRERYSIELRSYNQISVSHEVIFWMDMEIDELRFQAL